jgi:ABC-type multidrug transport system fused ATPase/permease subunit
LWVGLEAEEYDRQYKDRDLVKRILRYFIPHKRSMVFIIFILTISSLSRAVIPLITSITINNIQSNSAIFYIILAIIIIFILNLSGWILNYFLRRRISIVIGDVVLDLRQNASSAVLNHDLSFFDKNPLGKIVSRINTDSSDFSQVVELALDLVSSFIIIVFLLIVMSIINPTLFLLTLITFPLFFGVAMAYRKRARKRALLGQRALASVNSFVKESFSGIQIAKTFRQEGKLYENFNGVNNTAYKVNLRRGFTFSAH